jgi:isoleucyl-tRNA synthetase
MTAFHCWRCHNPVIFRATPQWFISMEHADLRQKALEAIKGVDGFLSGERSACPT